jgi:hypothetical protein
VAVQLFQQGGREDDIPDEGGLYDENFLQFFPER